jgi:hypothetical protein
MAAEWRLTPTLRVAVFSHLNRDGDEVLVETDAKTKLCCHGETGSSIRTWVLAESQACVTGKPLPLRNSVCDCKRTVGLQNNSVRTRLPQPPASVYDLLSSAANVEVVEMEGGCLAYRLGTYKAYLASSGAIYCKHGHELHTRTPAKRPCLLKAPRGTCDCQIVFPRRMPHLKLGRPVTQDQELYESHSVSATS